MQKTPGLTRFPCPTAIESGEDARVKRKGTRYTRVDYSAVAVINIGGIKLVVPGGLGRLFRFTVMARIFGALDFTAPAGLAQPPKFLSAGPLDQSFGRASFATGIATAVGST